MKTKKKPVILIRTDGSNKIGMGHVYRSIALSQELKKLGFSIHFLIPNNKIVLDKIHNYGKCHLFANNKNFEISIIRKLEPDIIILDILKKFFPYRDDYFKSLKKYCKLLVTIDYVGKETKYADMGIHTLFAPNKYKAKKLFYDLKYAGIRKEFVSAGKQFRVTEPIDSVLVLQGGADTFCVSPKILKALGKIKRSFRITLVLGPAFECWNELEKQKKLIKNKITILHNIKDIHKIMKNHQIAITAAGNTLIELLTVGVPSIIVYGERHENEIASIMHKKKLAINVGYGPTISQKKISKSVENLLDNFSFRRSISFKSKKIFDGQGTKRISKIILHDYKLLS